MHALSLFSDAFAEAGQRGGLLEGAMRVIGEEGAGVIVVINRPMPNALSTALNRRAGISGGENAAQLRDYGVGAQSLSDLDVQEMVLLTNTPTPPVALAGYGLSIVGEGPLPLAAALVGRS